MDKKVKQIETMMGKLKRFVELEYAMEGAEGTALLAIASDAIREYHNFALKRNKDNKDKKELAQILREQAKCKHRSWSYWSEGVYGCRECGLMDCEDMR